VISGGKLIVKDYKVTGVDEEAILKTSRELSLRLWNKFKIA
jgi:hypothetical protein